MELYDLASDIGARRNVADSHPDVTARIEEILSRVGMGEDAWPLKSKKRIVAF